MANIYYFNDWYKPSVPKPVKGGIKTRSSRGAIASKWWGKRWIDVLESFNIGARLSRGRSYARRGQVSKLTISPGKVIASVQGSSAKPYTITIDFKTYSIEEWEKIFAALSQNPILTADLLNGIMPEEIEEIFKDLWLPLFPQKQKDLQSNCSCPDWSNPCKHIAAVFYLLAEAFDNNPFLLFEIRGMQKSEILKALQSRTENQAENIVSELSEPLPLDADTFWGKAHADIEIQSATELKYPHLPMKLGEPNFWQSETSFGNSMERIYKDASKRAVKIWERISTEPDNSRE